MVETFRYRGWIRFAYDPDTAAWAARAREAARRAVAEPANARWHVCEGTWFVGVDALDNDAEGRVAGATRLRGPAVEFIRAHLGGMPPLHRAQVSVVHPGYPRPREGESEAAFRYRVRRDAAHLDGIKATGPDRRRRIEETHAFVLGLPLNATDEAASPLVVWEGSHEVMRAALAEALAPHDPGDWGRIDITDAYHAARRRVFETCRRVPLHAGPGEAYLLHRLALHGIAPWSETATAPDDGRVIAYFRPPTRGGVADWLKRGAGG